VLAVGVAVSVAVGVAVRVAVAVAVGVIVNVAVAVLVAVAVAVGVEVALGVGVCVPVGVGVGRFFLLAEPASETFADRFPTVALLLIMIIPEKSPLWIGANSTVTVDSPCG
jgi:hypothetical protein